MTEFVRFSVLKSNTFTLNKYFVRMKTESFDQELFAAQTVANLVFVGLLSVLAQTLELTDEAESRFLFSSLILTPPASWLSIRSLKK